MKKQARGKIAYLLVLGVVIVGLGGSAFYYVLNQRTPSNSSTPQVTVSNINATLDCGQIVSPPLYLKDSLDTLASQLMNSSKFKDLSQNNPFHYADSPGPGCSENVLNSTVTPVFDFSYQDMADPYTRCGETYYPSYQISAAVYLVPNGYELSRTQWSYYSYGPDNASLTLCSSATST